MLYTLLSIRHINKIRFVCISKLINRKTCSNNNNNDNWGKGLFVRFYKRFMCFSTLEYISYNKLCTSFCCVKLKKARVNTLCSREVVAICTERMVSTVFTNRTHGEGIISMKLNTLITGDAVKYSIQYSIQYSIHMGDTSQTAY